MSALLTLPEAPTMLLPDDAPPLKAPEELVSAELSAVYAEWRRLAGTRMAPSRKEISPARFKSVLGTVFLFDVVDDGADFRFALGGDKLMLFLSNRIGPGMLLSAISGSLFHERATRVFGLCVRTKRPVASGPSRASLQRRAFMSIEVLVLPLSDAPGRVTSLIGALHATPVVEPAPLDGSEQKAFPAG